MANELDVLLDKVDDPALRADLKRQVELLRAKRRFGLVFEEHLPERVQLPEHTIRRGTRVVRRDSDDEEPLDVVKVVKKKVTVRSVDGETQTFDAGDLVVVADFGEPIYPGLVAAFEQVGTFRGAAALCGTTHKTVKRVVLE
ncbi:MAG: hypothetical protein ACT4PW_13960, partial [Acidimicrobiia bacterium]